MALPDRLTALTCCNLIDTAYEMLDDWLEEQKPDEDNFLWTLYDKAPPMSLWSDPIWGMTRVRRRRKGPRHKHKFKWVYEWSPLVLLSIDDNNTLFVTSRGTRLGNEWDQNFRFPARPFETGGEIVGSVHQGFGDSFASIEADLFEELAEIITRSGTQPSQIVVTGHSLGGAVATLMVTAIAKSDWLNTVGTPPLSCVTFAAPRAATPSFQEQFDALGIPFWRVENTDDLVPDVPPKQILLCEYTHLGQLIEFNGNKGSLGGNHSMVTYREAVEKSLT